MSYARIVRDGAVAPSFPGDATPRLLLIDGSTVGEYARGRLLMSPWSAFRGVFPMHGTYFAQNEVFEDESAGEVQLPLASLGAECRVYLGKSIEGVLRYRSRSELTSLFKESFVCIRRYRSSDARLLPLILDPPRLIKHKAAPSALALQLGLTQPLPTPPTGGAPLSNQHVAEALARSAISTALEGEGHGAHRGVEEAVGEAVAATSSESRLDSTGRAAGMELGCAGEDVTAGVTAGPELTRGLRLFSLYLAAGGALCLRPLVWRRLLPCIHPDKGGDTVVFQHLNDLKRRVDANHVVELPLVPSRGTGAEGEDVNGVYEKIRAELQHAAKELGDLAVARLGHL